MAKWKVSAVGIKDGLPAIEYWRHGVAANGEANIVTRVQTFVDTKTRDAALFPDKEN